MISATVGTVKATRWAGFQRPVSSSQFCNL